MGRKKKPVWDKYIDAVLSGKEVAGKYLRLACQRHRDDQQHGEARGIRFDPKKAGLACEFFPRILRHSVAEWAGQPFELTPNQAFIVASLFGWRRIAEGGEDLRRYRSGFITAARKWGKTSLAAGIALQILVADDPLEREARCFCCAAKEDQAKEVFNAAQSMVRESPALQGVLKCFQKSISTQQGAPQGSGCFLKPLGSDSPNSGHNTHLVIMDELHEWRPHHQPLYDVMTSAGGSRRAPLILAITTAGDDNSHIWEARHNYAVSVLEAAGRGDAIADNHFVFVAELDEEDDPWDEANWKKANPNMPTTPKLAYLREQAEERKGDPVGERAFLRYHCNRRVAATARYLDPELWAACRGELSDWSEAEYVGGGSDFGGFDDLCSCALCAKFPMGTDESGKTVYRYEVTSKSWIKATTHRRLTREPWYSWLQRGLLTKTERPITDAISYIREREAQQWAYDNRNAAKFGEELAEEFGPDYVFEMPQHFRHFTEPMQQLKEAAKEGRLIHDGDEILSWAVGNMQAKFSADGEQCMPAKKQSRGKIDPIVAVLMAFRVAYFAEKQEAPMIW